MDKFPYKSPANRLKVVYVLALSLIAMLTIVSQFFIHRALKRQENDSRIVNISGRQRMLSQRIAKNTLLLKDTVQHPEVIDELLTSYQEWQVAHKVLQQGNGLGIGSISNSDTIRQLYRELSKPYEDMVVAINMALTNPESLSIAQEKILRSEKLFLNIMDKITFQYDLEAKNKVWKLKRVELILMFTTLIILILEGLFIFRPSVNFIATYFKQLSMANKQLSQQSEALAKSRETAIKLAIESQEHERKHIGRELHDGIGHNLSLVKLNLSNIDAEDPKVNSQITAITKKIDEITTEVRHVAHHLLPNVLEQFGLEDSLKHLLEDSQQSFTGTIHQYFKINSSFSTAGNLSIYRICQELLNNVLKHAVASELSLQVITDDDNLVIIMEDDGKGFDPQLIIQQKNGMGLNNIASRVMALNGHYHIESEQGKGTTFTIYLPMENLKA
ncbi:MAG: ATP-binding protein [Chitinophagales bacterium]|nr:ATP-binding protein [Chitinophagales bacterium]